MTPYEQRIQTLCDRFGFKSPKLQTEANGLPIKDDGRPLDEVVNDFNKEQRKGVKLKVATASTNFIPEGSSKPMTRLYFDFKP